MLLVAIDALIAIVLTLAITRSPTHSDTFWVWYSLWFSSSVIPSLHRSDSISRISPSKTAAFTRVWVELVFAVLAHLEQR